MGDDDTAQPQSSRLDRSRIRDNQRRSRARHKEYVDDLEARVRDHERRGVVATLDMQQAARAVALENKRLRMLLVRHGVQDAEVLHFLSSFTADDRSQGTHETGTSRERQEEAEENAQAPGGISTETIMEACCGGQTRCVPTEPIPQPRHEPSGSSPRYPEVFGPTTPVDLTSPMEMSCEAAASLLAEMGARGDRDLIKASLGCGDKIECLVKNTRLFQVLDGSTEVI